MQRKRSTVARQNVKPSGSPKAKKSYDRDSSSRSSSKSFGGRRSNDDSEKSFDKPRRTSSSGDKPFFKKKEGGFEDRPKRSYSNDEKPRFAKRDSEKSFDKPRRTFNSDNDKPAFKKREGGFEDRPKRSYSNDEKPRFAKRDSEKSFDKPRRTFNADNDKPAFKKREGGFEDRPKRSYSNDEKPRFAKRDSEKSFDKPRRTFNSDNDKPAFKKREGGFEDRPKRSYSNDKPNKGSFGDKKTFSDDKNLKKDSRPFRERVTPTETENTFEEKNYTLRTRKPKIEKKESDGTVRLNRYIANSGVCSRREADELISQGLVTVNGKVVTEMGVKVLPTDIIKYDGKTLKSERNVYVLLNKPKDFITTTDDPQERKTVMQLVANAAKERIYPVGRLDRNTTGLLLFTNDGELAEKLTHPSRNIAKVYEVVLDKPITNEDFEKIKNGVRLFDGIATVDDLQIVGGNKSQLGIEIHIGRNRIVRRIFEHLGYEVVILDRVSYAGLTKKDLPRGSWRILSEREVNRLKNM
jgi:23S rRNA pseudouridine2605 synthase